ncbi:alpha/beta fold hydrolase [Croceibacterium ferulae]|uniref:alpha/beta fold hydrolase n=1 Tax=Croceibacterium ferulae TaxID=1854641 RepID=UPI000EAD86FB|nr:alpha/beta hydrolase [Croceibacterium ferulae]
MTNRLDDTTSLQSRFPAELQMTTIDGLSVRYAHTHALRDEAETLLLLSPWPESLMAFLPIWDRLTERYNVLALDLPGFGGSEGRADVIAPEAMGDFIDKAVRHFGLVRPHAVGPDVGTSALLFAAANHPRSFSSITIGSGAVSFPLDVASALADLIAAPIEDLRAIVAEDLIDDVLATMLDYVVPQFVRQDYIKSYQGERYAESARFVRRYPEELLILQTRLSDIQTPVLVIVGRKDPFVPVTNGHYLADRIPNARLQIIDAGHFVWEEAAEPYADHLLDWAATHKRGQR